MQQNDASRDHANPYAAPLALSEEAPAVAGETIPLADFRPFRSMWTRPRVTVRTIVATDPELYVLPLVAVSGVVEVLDRASGRNAGDSLSLTAILGMACAVGPLGGLFQLWIASHLIRFSGFWLGGTGNREHLKTAIAWSLLPSACSLAFWAVQLLLLGGEMFTTETPRLDAQPMLWIPFGATVLGEVTLGVWSFVLLCHAVAEVQGYRSAWRGLGNLVLAWLVVFIPLLALVLVGVFLAVLAR